MKFSYNNENKTFSILNNNKQIFTCNSDTILTENMLSDFLPTIVYEYPRNSEMKINKYIQNGSLTISFNENKCSDIETISLKSDDTAYVKTCQLYFRRRPKDAAEVKSLIHRNFEPMLKYNEKEPNIRKHHVKIILANAKPNRSYIEIKF